MQIFQILTSKGKIFIVWIAGLSIINSVLYLSIFFFIHNIINQRQYSFFLGTEPIVFLLVFAFSFFVNSRFRRRISQWSNEIMFEYEVSLINKIRAASFQSFEKIQFERIYSTLSESRIIRNFAEQVGNTINAGVVTVCGVFYLFFISIPSALLLIVTSCVLIYYFKSLGKSINQQYSAWRELHGKFLRYLRDIIYGFKELRLNNRQNETCFHDFVRPNREKARAISDQMDDKHLRARLLLQYSFYLLTFLIIFVLPVFKVTAQQIAALIIALLYVIAGIGSIAQSIPYYSTLKVALEKLEELKTDLEKNLVSREGVKSSASLGDFRSLAFEGVTYSYFGESGNEVFTLGPVDLSLKRGEILFITGGNGSGKSTFVNLLTGLYRPLQGGIYFNDIAVDEINCDQYRNSISAVFSKPYLFSENYGKYELSEPNTLVNELIDNMRLRQFLRIRENNTFDLKLSNGQQKRLALIYALIEGRDILILDEWAAEQDPEFRDYFYKSLLPKFRDQGKLIVVVSHDNKYFHLADKIMRLDFGRTVTPHSVNIEVDS